jgi:hypothetical protein
MWGSIPGTSCQATFIQSLWDEIASSGRFSCGYPASERHLTEKSRTRGAATEVPLITSHLTSPLLRQHEIPDNGSEITATGYELSKGAARRPVRIESIWRQAVFRVSSTEIDKLS